MWILSVLFGALAFGAFVGSFIVLSDYSPGMALRNYYRSWFVGVESAVRAFLTYKYCQIFHSVDVVWYRWEFGLIRFCFARRNWLINMSGDIASCIVLVSYSKCRLRNTQIHCTFWVLRGYSYTNLSSWTSSDAPFYFHRAYQECAPLHGWWLYHSSAARVSPFIRCLYSDQWSDTIVFQQICSQRCKTVYWHTEGAEWGGFMAMRAGISCSDAPGYVHNPLIECIQVCVLGLFW